MSFLFFIYKHPIFTVLHRSAKHPNFALKKKLMFRLNESKRFVVCVSGVDLRKGLNGHFHFKHQSLDT